MILWHNIFSLVENRNYTHVYRNVICTDNLFAVLIPFQQLLLKNIYQPLIFNPSFRTHPSNFTDFSLRKRTGNHNAILSEKLEERVALMNPMNFIRESDKGIAAHWYIRHGAKDRDTSFLVPLNLATRLRNAGYDVDFALPWNRPHSGDYNLDDLFRWIEQVK